MRDLIWAVFLVCASCLYAHAESAAPPAIPVGTVKAERKPVSRNQDFVGRVEAINRVEVRARVKGFLEDVLFKEGDLIKEGTPLYRIEKGLFNADVQQAEGALERSKAANKLAQLNLDLAQELLKRGAGTVVARDKALMEVQTTEGQILTDEGKLNTSRINLGYTTISSPIAGKIGKTSVTKGNVVGPDSGPLTVVVSQDPMYVTFPISRRELLLVPQGGGGHVDAANIKVQLRYSDGSAYDQIGKINFIDVTVDRATDTVIVRATMPNPNGALIDNQLMRVVLQSGKLAEKIVVPQAALISDQEGVYVFVVETGKAAIRRLKVGSEAGTEIVVEQGLSGGEQVIVQGLPGVRPGMAVRTAPIARALSEK